MHSTFSDGTDTPTQLVQQANDLGLSAIALTDHDSMAGIPELFAAAQNHALEAIAGVELSIDCRLPADGHMHILGLFVDHENDELVKKLAFLATERERRAERIVARFNELGISCTLDELNELAGEGVIGRPHLARLLITKGVVSTIQEAFENYLGKGKVAYVDKVKLDEAAAISLIHAAGGLAILAHPQFLGFDKFDGIADRIVALKNMGLDGVEVYYAGMPTAFAEKLTQLAKSLDLARSGGSDYHGSAKPDTFMGTGIDNDLAIPDDILTSLKSRL